MKEGEGMDGGWMRDGCWMDEGWMDDGGMIEREKGGMHHGWIDGDR